MTSTVRLLPRVRLLLRLRPFDDATEEGRSLERYRRIGLTTVSGFAYRLFSMAISLVTVPLILGALGKARFGLWTTITTVTAWVALFDLGLSNGLVNRLAKAYGRQDNDEANRYFVTALAAMIGLAAILAVVLAVAIPLVPWSRLLGVRGEVDDATVLWSVVAMLGAFVVTMPLGVVTQLYAGFQRAYATNGFNLVGVLVGFGCLLLALWLAAPMPLLIVAISAGAVLAPIAALAYALARGFPWLRLRYRDVSRSALRSLMALSVPMFLFQVGALAVNETQSIILAQRCGLATVADFGIAMRLYLLTASLIQLGTGSFLPPLREAHERGDTQWARTAFGRLLVVRLGIALAGGLVMSLLGNAIVRVWLGRTDIAFARHVWIALAVLQVSTVWASTYSELLWIMDRLWVLVALVAANGAVTIWLTWRLAPQHGVLGAILAVGAVTVLLNVWLLPILARDLLRPRRASPSLT
ncbi:MAG: MATE family efflux transporter [Deltaproteobacteria bacterium]|nr:MATE family efflux transporter [Deltaproteobacteria bacterium]